MSLRSCWSFFATLAAPSALWLSTAFRGFARRLRRRAFGPSLCTSPERARPYFDYYRLSDVERISNPDSTLYQLPAFALSRTNPYLQLFNLAVWKGWLKGAMFKYGVGLIREDGYQMPGVFFLKERRIARAFRHREISDEPDYLKLISEA